MPLACIRALACFKRRSRTHGTFPSSSSSSSDDDSILEKLQLGTLSPDSGVLSPATGEFEGFSPQIASPASVGRCAGGQHLNCGAHRASFGG